MQRMQIFHLYEPSRRRILLNSMMCKKKKIIPYSPRGRIVRCVFIICYDYYYTLAHGAYIIIRIDKCTSQKEGLCPRRRVQQRIEYVMYDFQQLLSRKQLPTCPSLLNPSVYEQQPSLGTSQLKKYVFTGYIIISRTIEIYHVYRQVLYID